MEPPAPNDPTGDHKIIAIAVLTAIEFVSLKHGDVESRGLIMRELNKEPSTMLDRFAALMVDYEAKFELIKAANKLEAKWSVVFEAIFKSWKENRFSATFHEDVVAVLFDTDMMPIYIESPSDKETLKHFVKEFQSS